MSKIRIKNFGPIKEGFDTEDGFMDIKKVTVFIGDQGTGKSTVAKLISTFMWMEKAINRGDVVSENLFAETFFNICEYQLIQNYFLHDTEVDYRGNFCSISYRTVDRFLNVTLNSSRYSTPQIQYISAERNFLTTIQNAYNVQSLPWHLISFAEELKRAQRQLGNVKLDLPIKNYQYEYIESSDESFIHGKDYKLDLFEASSGLQSLIPMYLVSRNLALSIHKIDGFSRLSAKHVIKRNEEADKIANDTTLSKQEIQERIWKIYTKFQNTCFINIVEEPEQNLFPTSQRHLLNSLVEFANMNEGNKLIMTTHSPYIINYLTLATKANEVLGKINSKHKDDLKDEFNKIVPESSVIAADDLIIYELKDNGTIKKLETYNGLPSDENYLNQQLAETNYLFTDLLEIEDQCQ